MMMMVVVIWARTQIDGTFERVICLHGKHYLIYSISRHNEFRR